MRVLSLIVWIYLLLALPDVSAQAHKQLLLLGNLQQTVRSGLPDTAAYNEGQLGKCLHLALKDIKQVGQLSKLLLLKC